LVPDGIQENRKNVRSEQNSKKKFMRTVRSSSRVKGQFKGRLSSSSEKAVLVGVRSLASLAVWLDQEEELVQLVPEEFKELPVLSKSC
jgi:hypothetical protein